MPKAFRLSVQNRISDELILLQKSGKTSEAFRRYCVLLHRQNRKNMMLKRILDKRKETRQKTRMEQSVRFGKFTLSGQGSIKLGEVN